MLPDAAGTLTTRPRSRHFKRKKITVRGSTNVQNTLNSGDLLRLTASKNSTNELCSIGRVYLQRRALYYPRTAACALELVESTNPIYASCRNFLEEKLSDVTPVRAPARDLALLFSDNRNHPSDRALADCSISALWGCIVSSSYSVPGRVLSAAFRLAHPRRPRTTTQVSHGRGSLASNSDIIFDFVNRVLQKSVEQPLQAGAMVPSVAQCIVKMARYGPKLLKALARCPHKDLSQVFMNLGLMHSVVRLRPSTMALKAKRQSAVESTYDRENVAETPQDDSNSGTVVFLKIYDVLRKTRDPSFIFGTGPGELRDCPAKLAVLEFARVFQEEIRRVKGSRADR